MDRCEIIRDDYQAIQILKGASPRTELGERIKAVCLDAADQVSFVEHQTYPRPNHPNINKRFSHLFTFCSVIISLRCTLEVEVKVTDELLAYTEGQENILLAMSIKDLKKIIKPSGMADKKSEWIFDGLKTLCQLEKGVEGYSDEELRRKILQIRGMGNKATDCYMLLGIEKPVFPVDVNVFKITINLLPELFQGSVPSFNNKKDVERVKNFYEIEFQRDTQLYQVMHTYLLLANRYKIAIKE